MFVFKTDTDEVWMGCSLLELLTRDFYLEQNSWVSDSRLLSWLDFKEIILISKEQINNVWKEKKTNFEDVIEWY